MSVTTSKWRGVPPEVDRVSRLDLLEVRVLAYLMWCSAARKRTSRIEVGQIHGANGAPIGPRAALEVCQDLHDAGLVMMQLDGVADSTPVVVWVHGTAAPAAMSAGRVEQQRKVGVDVGGGFMTSANTPPDLVTALQEVWEEHQQVYAVVPAERNDAWVSWAVRTAQRRAAAFNRWSTMDSSVRIRREAEKLTREADVMASRLSRPAQPAAVAKPAAEPPVIPPVVRSAGSGALRAPVVSVSGPDEVASAAKAPSANRRVRRIHQNPAALSVTVAADPKTGDPGFQLGVSAPVAPVAPVVAPPVAEKPVVSKPVEKGPKVWTLDEFVDLWPRASGRASSYTRPCAWDPADGLLEIECETEGWAERTVDLERALLQRVNAETGERVVMGLTTSVAKDFKKERA
jgi:hypothetical protein